MHVPTPWDEVFLQVSEAMRSSSGGDGYRRVVVSRLGGAMPGAEKQAWKRSVGSLSLPGTCSVVVLELAETTVRWVASSSMQAERFLAA